jgi:hypothetical protein
MAADKLHSRFSEIRLDWRSCFLTRTLCFAVEHSKYKTTMRDAGK